MLKKKGKVRWAQKLTEVHTYIHEKQMHDTINFANMSVEGFSYTVWKQLDLLLQKRICSLCGGQWLVPVQFESNRSSIFGLYTKIGILVVLNGEIDVKRTVNRVVVPGISHAPQDFYLTYITYLFEATEQDGRLVLVRLSPQTKALVIEHVRKNCSGLSTLNVDSFFAKTDNDFDTNDERKIICPEMLPSGRFVNDLCKRWRPPLI